MAIEVVNKKEGINIAVFDVSCRCNALVVVMQLAMLMQLAIAADIFQSIYSRCKSFQSATNITLQNP